MTIELRQLRYFVAVAEERHFGRAAARLRIAQPGLSQQIKRLERSIGVPLLVRDKRHVEMTKAGEVLLEQARIAIEVVDRAVDAVRAAGRGKTAVLKVGAYALGVYPEATALLLEFGARFPHVDVQLHPGHTQQSLAELTRRRLDVAIVLVPFEAPAEVHYRALGMIEPVVALPSDHRLAGLDRIPRSGLLTETVFTWPRGLNPALGDHIRAVFFGEVKHERLVELADVTETLVRVAGGEGIAITYPAVAALEISNVVFRRLEDPVPTFEYGMVWLDDAASPSLPSLVDLADEMSDRVDA